MSEDTTPKKEEEVDLGQLFKIIGNALKSVFIFIGNVLYNVFAFLIVCLLFLKKNALIFIAAAVIAYGYTYYTNSVKEPVYESTAIVQPNFQLMFQLQSRIAEYNQLILLKDTVTLSKKLGVPLDEVGAFKSFNIEPFYSLNKVRFDYYSYLQEQADTTLYRKFTFETYEKDLRFEDYTDYIITATSKNQEGFDILNTTLWDFSDSENILDRRKRELTIIKSEKDLLERTLKSIDSTRATQREVMLKEVERAANTASNTNIDLGSRQAYREDPGIYDFENTLREDLVKAVSNIEDRQNLVNVLKKFPENGRYVGGADVRVTVVVAIGLVLIILLLLRLWKYLNRIENKGEVKYKKLG